ncbi:cystathionine beta-synthase [Fusarium falciforme]|nr:cystathionine beta-synthase [Fusarium falciforme]KAJ4243192.1 cystathionine beta-synthase [Fusarium falciforme]
MKMSSLAPEASTPANSISNAIDLIGETPLIHLSKLPKALGIKCEVLVKAEFFNLGGSTKDRVALRMIEEAEKAGKIKPGDTLIEPTSGNTGIGLALIALLKGYKTIITLPSKMSLEKVTILRALGAKIIRTPDDAAWDSPESHHQLAAWLQSVLPNAHILGQFGNPDNPQAHEDTTAQEIWRQTKGKVTAIVAGAGTGGTITGLARGLKKHNKNIKAIGADPQGSILAAPDSLNKDHLHEPHQVEGIGGEFVPGVLDRNIVDKWYKTADRESFYLARRLIAEEGLLVGGSSGAAMAAMFKAVKDFDFKEGDKVVVVMPDGIRNYLSKFANDDWLKANNLFPLDGRDLPFPPSSGVENTAVTSNETDDLTSQLLSAQVILPIRPPGSCREKTEVADEHAHHDFHIV